MRHVFISHAGADEQISAKLCADLKDVGHDVKIDLHELKLGVDSIDFMNDAIADAHTVVIVYSVSTPNAKWQKLEINGALWNEHAQHGAKVIVLKLGSPKLPPLLGPKVYGSLDPDSYKSTLESLCQEITDAESATSILCEALQEDSDNPFWRVRAEYFEEMPRLLADAFSPPESAKIGVLEQMKPCFLEGSRGTGKTMLLLALRGRILASRSDSPKSIADIFGFYLRLNRGAFCNADVGDDLSGLKESTHLATPSQLTDIFAQEFYLTLLESMASEVQACLSAGFLSLTAEEEIALVDSIGKVANLQLVGKRKPLQDLLDELAGMHRALAEFVRRRFIYGEEHPVPFACFDLTSFKSIVKAVRNSIPALASAQFTVLLDEYENLLPHQKRVVNTAIKLGPPSFSVKVARKVGTDESSATTEGQELQETHDYNRIPLVYSVEDETEFARYHKLLGNMVERLLRSRGLQFSDLATLLPTYGDEEVPPQDLRKEVLTLLKTTPEEFDSWPTKRQSERLQYYEHAAVYRCLYGRGGRRRPKRFSGASELAFVSSGVIRYFQEILGMAYHLQSSSDEGMQGEILPSYQSEAVRTVSSYSLATLSRNVETCGEQLKYLLLDLGDCLRQKLLRHSSEPEAGRVAISDPERLRQDSHATLRRLIDLGFREGVFQSHNARLGIRPKHVEDPQPIEINIARIYAPALRISPRQRWTTLLRCDDLERLIGDETRRPAKRELTERLVGSKRSNTNPAQGLLVEDA